MTWYNVKNIDKFVKETMDISFAKFNESNENLDDPISSLLVLCRDEDKNDILSEKEAKTIILEHIKKRKNKYKISENIFLEILLNLNSRIVSNSLRVLASKDIIEMAFDDELNDFVFWKKDEKKDEKESEEK